MFVVTIASVEEQPEAWLASPLSVVVSIATLLALVSTVGLCSKCCGEQDSDEDMSYLEDASNKQHSGMSLSDIEQQEYGSNSATFIHWLKRFKQNEKGPKRQVVTNDPPSPFLSKEAVQPRGMSSVSSQDSDSQFSQIPGDGRRRYAKSVSLPTPTPARDTSQDRRPSLFQNFQDTFASLTLKETARGEDQGLGILEFGVFYDFTFGTLMITVCRAHDIPAADYGGTSDPYVRVSLEPDKSTRVKTKVRRRQLNPVWNETLRYEGFPMRKLLERILTFQIRDWDQFSRDDILGQIQVPLSAIDLQEGPVKIRHYIAPYFSGKYCQGEIEISLTYNNNMGRLAIGVIRATNLKAMDVGGNSDPYVKVHLVHAGVTGKKEKTEVIKKTLAPFWDTTLHFDIPHFILRDVSLHLFVKDYDTFKKNDIIGEVVFSLAASGKEQAHWKAAVLDRPGETITDWHLIRKKMSD